MSEESQKSRRANWLFTENGDPGGLGIALIAALLAICFSTASMTMN